MRCVRVPVLQGLTRTGGAVGPPLRPNTVGAFVDRMNAYVESDDGRLQRSSSEFSRPSATPHVAEFFNFYNTNDELATTAEDAKA